MALGKPFGDFWKLVLAGLAGSVLTMGAFFAVQTATDVRAGTEENTILACRSIFGILRMVDSHDECRTIGGVTETPVEWNIVGPQGPPGPVS